MTSGHRFKRVSLWAVMGCCALVNAYLAFICLISLWVGLTSSDRPGFWVPLAAGALALPLVVFLGHRIIRRLRHLLIEEDVLRR
jgi:hypothetical protein